MTESFNDFMLDDDSFEFESLDTTDYDANLAEVCFKIVGWWTEDYPFEDLLEELDVLPEEALYNLVKSGLITEDQLQKFLDASE